MLDHGPPGPPSREGFEYWVAPHWAAMAGLACRLASPAEAEDIVQEAVLLAWRKRERFDSSKGTARTWLLALTADQARRFRRRARRVSRTFEVPDTATHPPETGDLDLRAATMRLSYRQRLAVAAYYYLDLPIREVAAVMACSEGTVKSTLADARSRLRQLLQEETDHA
ncbi:MAG: RNA polymerase sigma factor [Pseudonocardiales bacterium]|nr:MAG: RNA polymerase sigma factor [Pseudonocardiales bacterium]